MALIPAGYLTAVVSLGVLTTSGYDHQGTGFVYQHPVGKAGKVTTYLPVLVSNRHVVSGKGLRSTHIRFDSPSDGSLSIDKLDSLASGEWILHPKADVAVRAIRPNSELTLGRNDTDTDVFLGDRFTTFAAGVQLSEGDGVFIIGFPLDLIGKEQNYPIVRYGVVSRIQDWIRGDKNTFLIDVPAFPGNSGGPVIVKPEMAALPGTEQIRSALLAGVIRSNIRARDVAVSRQTGEARIVFVENTGLTEVVPIEKVREAAAMAAEALGLPTRPVQVE